MKRRTLIRVTGAAVVFGLGLVFGMVSLGSARAAKATERVTICHKWDEPGDPYDIESPVATADVRGHDDHPEDIIPPFTYEENGVTGHYPGKNWTPAGQAILANGCDVPTDTTPTETTPTQTTPTQTTPTQTTPTVPTTPVTPSIDLSVTKTDSPDPATVGNSLVYTIQASNGSSATATGVVVTDQLPAGVTLVSVSASQGSCSGQPTMVCALGSLGPGATATITIVVQPTAAGTITNTVTIHGGQPDSNPLNDTAVATTVVNGVFSPPAVGCTSLRVAPRSLAVGQRVSLRVVALGGTVSGLQVRVRGAGISASARTNAQGVANVRVMGRRPGVATVTVAGQSCSARFGVLGAFQPPLTG
jgi:uncharacterized repeat protein (TIGR01451 family)